MRLSDVMSHTDLSVFPEMAMVLFLAAFAAVMWRLFGGRGAAELSAHGAMPLEDCRAADRRAGDGRERP